MVQDNSDLSKRYGVVTAVIGAQWGDEGKGKLVDILAEQYPLIVRATGGANAGHTVYIPDPADASKRKKFVFHLMPSGLLYPHTVGVIGNGCVIHIPTFLDEVKTLKENGVDVRGRVFLSDRAHLTFEYHKIIDGLQEDRKGANKVGTTKRGIGPTYTNKIARIGIRVHELLDFDRFSDHMRQNVKVLQEMYHFEFDIEAELAYYKSVTEELKPYITDTALYIDQELKKGRQVLLEGANGTLLDIDHGTYPFVTSSNATLGGIIAGSGIAALKIKSAIGIMKAYCTRVGSGPFPTELSDVVGEKLRTLGGEFGATTGRPRRCGWFDAVAARYSVMINGLTHVNITKLDVLDDFDVIRIGVGYSLDGKPLQHFPASLEMLDKVQVDYIEMPGWKQSIKHARTFNELPVHAQNYIKKIQELIECPVDTIGVGMLREEMVMV